MDVLVLGGGVAGLRAAIALAAAGRRVCLLEGRDRLGGRIHSSQEPGWPVVEAGAEFVHGKPPVIERLCRRLGARLLEHEPQHLLFGVQLPASVLRAGLQGWRLFDWQQDPFARGAYSFSPPDGVQLPHQLAAPIADTLFFAGEAAHTGGATGTVHGAMESGDRAAQLCMSSLGVVKRTHP